MTDTRAAASRLRARLAELEAEDAAGAEARRVVALDQTSVGRLSRMDALQGQAMAQAAQRRRGAERVRIAAALGRIEAGDYGYCTRCGDEIAPARLAVDAAIALCAGCIRGR